MTNKRNPPAPTGLGPRAKKETRMTPYKLPEPTPKGAIADRGVFRSLVRGSGYLNHEAPHEERLWGQLPWVREFWEKHAPELADFGCRASDDDDVAYAEIRHWRGMQHSRLRFLMVNDLLAGEAAADADNLKRAHERYEWSK